MKYTDEYRNPKIARRLIDKICERAPRPLRIMEFCGGHTHAIMRYGIRDVLGPQVEMLSGPGCPVCVTADVDIDRAVALAHLPDVTVATFGDMVRVPGTRSSLQEATAAGAQVEIVYSALDALALARRNPQRLVVMLGIGFETTAPTVAASLVEAQESGVDNYHVYALHKLTPPAMRGILDAGEVRLDAVLGPGHVTAITGWEAWNFLPQEYGIPCAVSGFEPLDILQAVLDLIEAKEEDDPRVVNTYSRGTRAKGNLVAKALMDRVFRVSPALWRGLGEIPQSGLTLRSAFAAHDAEQLFDRLPPLEKGGPSPDERGCRCGEVLRGVVAPLKCPLFGEACTPARPVGPCMVSAEGACAAYYRYRSA